MEQTPNDQQINDEIAGCWCETKNYNFHFSSNVGETYVIREACFFKRTGPKATNKRKIIFPALFCPLCGKKLNQVCPTCNRPYDLEA